MSMWLVDLDRSAPARSVEFEPSEPARQTGRRLSRGMSCRPVMMSTNIMASSLLMSESLHTLRMISNSFIDLQYRI